MTEHLPDAMVEAGAEAQASVIAQRHGHERDDWLNDQRREEAAAAYRAMRPLDPEVQALVEALEGCVDMLLDQCTGSYGHDLALKGRDALARFTDAKGEG